MMFLLYLLAVMAAAAALLRVYAAARAIGTGVPPMLAVCVCAGALFYLSGLVPGALAILGPEAVAVTLVGLSGLLFWASARVRRAADASPIAPRAVAMAPGDGFVALAAPIPALLYYAVTTYRPWASSRSLSWDSVSYHLPGFIEYVQAGSLYSLDGPYQTYGFGFDLIGNFPGYFFTQHWGVFFAHVYALVFFGLALFTVTRSVQRLTGDAHPLGYRVAYFVAVSLLVAVQGGAIFTQVGKGDVFQAACVLAAMGLLLEVSWNADAASGTFRVPVLFGVAATALALALATKPTALAYVSLLPLTAGVLWLVQPPGAPPDGWRSAMLIAGASAVAVVMLGGFFLIRNVLLTGGLVGEDGADGWRMSILANAANPRVYELKRNSLIFAASLIAPFGVFLAGGPAGRRLRVLRAQAALFALTALAAFVVSPFVIVPPESADRWELRQGISHFALAAVAYGVVAFAILARMLPGPLGWVRKWTSGGPAPATRPGDVAPRVATAGGVLLVCVAASVPFWWTPPKGLPGYERIRGMPRTTVYEWVQALDEPVRIYSAGLRPFGLYGPAWRNRVFYDLHSTLLLDEPAGKARIAAVVTEFRPDLLLISVDPNDSAAPLEKPLVGWLRNQAACFEEVFDEPAVSGFKVKPGCEQLIKAHLAPELKLRMSA
jgi:hypothetical protein